MTSIDSVLLYELRAMPLSPSNLQARLTAWGHRASQIQVVEALRSLRTQGLVDGPGVSAIHNQPVWLTHSGKLRASNLGGDVVSSSR
jgi:hypothetical protein